MFKVIGSPIEATKEQIALADERVRESSKFIFPFANGEELSFVGCFWQPAENDGADASYLVFRFKSEKDGHTGDVTRKMLCNRGKKILTEDVTLLGMMPVNSLPSDLYKLCNKKDAKFIAVSVPDYYSSGTRRISDFGVIQMKK
jgi:hypothetical protein